MELPKILVRQVQEGRVVLCCGAGASVGAQLPDGSEPPLGDALRDRIGREFLDIETSNESLSWVAELAISEANLFDVQDFIADQFRNICPADFHLLIPTFRWRGIATTNYDRLIETAYETADKPIQKCVPFLSDNDRVDRKLRAQSALGLLKLHGCITSTHDASLPLILSVDQYATYRDSRRRVFGMLEEWASENVVVFVGQRLLDPNLRAVLLDLTHRLASRPRYYLLRPGVSRAEKTFWASKQITVVDGSFEDFLRSLDRSIEKRSRPLAARIRVDHPIQRRFVVPNEPSASLLEFLDSDAEYIHDGISIESGTPEKFYKGHGLGWYPIINDLDVQRRLTSQVIDEVILRPEEDRTAQVELCVIRAEAGAGKSVLLRRIAWDSAIQAGVLCLRYRGTAPPSLEALRELSESTNERIFMFMDSAADHVPEIRAVLEFAAARKLKLTIVTAERENEWNIGCESLEEFLSEDYRLRYLSESEIESLLDLLEANNALGPNLIDKTQEERIEEFVKRAGRQLLVALHEANLGKPFEEILLDEYEQIAPAEAQRLYLSVCVLNRLKVPVRAGLISRVHGIPFDDFQKRLFSPLEHVVMVQTLPWGDYGYIARHSQIAQIVFERVLTDSEDRFNEYARLIAALNPMYSTDLEALRAMLRAHYIHSLFPAYEDARSIYEAAEKALGEDAFLLQQRGNYERLRPDGNLRLAESMLGRARELNPTDTTIVHTLAEVLRSRALASNRPLERQRFRSEAAALLNTIGTGSASARYSAVTKLKLATDNIRDLLKVDASADRDIDESVRKAEKAFDVARQRYPGDKYIHLAESEFAQLLRDNERSIDALERAREANPRDPYITSRLASVLAERNEVERALGYLQEALDSHPGDGRLNYQYAELLRKGGEASAQTLIYHYRKSFSKWDGNHDSQFWFARFTFDSPREEDRVNSREVFRHLGNVPMPHEERVRIRDAIGGLDEPKEFSGTITRIEASHGFAAMDGSGDWVFFHNQDLPDPELWANLAPGSRVVFSVGFCLRGPKALSLRFENQPNA